MAKKNKVGRPTIFKKSFASKMIEYFDIESNYEKEIVISKGDYEKVDYKEFANNLPTIQGFCRLINIDKQTLHNWLDDAKSKEYQQEDKQDKIEFFDAYKRCKDMQEQIWIENSLKGLYNPAFAIFLGKNIFDYKDKSEVKHEIDPVGEIVKQIQEGQTNQN